MARYLKKARALFQHIPRTGGSWVEKAIDLCGVARIGWLEKQPPWIPRKHALLSHYYHKPMAEVEFVFAFVRHPIPYYESVWKWLGKNGGTKIMRPAWTWHPHATAARWYQPDFDDWLYLMLEKEPLWYTRLIEQYVGPRGGEYCNFIGRTEHLLGDFCQVMNSLGYVEQVEHNQDGLSKMGRRNVINQDIEWSPDLKAKMLETEQIVIERFYAGGTQ